MKILNLNTGKLLKIAVIIIFSAIFCQSLCSQSIMWQRTYHVFPNDFGYKILPAPNNCFYFVGSIDNIISSYLYILKIDQQGDTLWSRRISGGLYTAALSSDSSCVFANRIGLDSLIIYKITRDGNIGWQRIINAGGICWDMKKIYDNGYIICGITNQSAFALRIDSAGSFIWQKIFGGGSSRGFYSVAENFPNGLVFAGVNQKPDSTKIYVVKLDYDGNVIWEKNYAANNNRNVGQRICILNNNYLVGGNTDVNFYKTFLLRLDTAGNLLQTKIWTPYGTSKEWLDDLSVINSNKIVISKRVDSSSTLYVYAKAQLIDSNFNLLREQVYYPSYSYAIFSSILPLPNKDILFAGTFDYYTSWWSRRYDMYAVRTDSNLNTSPLPPIGITYNYNNLPHKFILYQNYPNPFNPTTSIKYEIPKNAQVTLNIYDILGKEVFSYNEYKLAGSYEVKFDGSNLASGMYFYTLKAETSQLSSQSSRDVFTETKKMVLLK